MNDLKLRIIIYHYTEQVEFPPCPSLKPLAHLEWVKHTLCVVGKLPPSMGGTNGKVLTIL